jgi:uncharacterized repeat protein (TIGR03803 family)
MAVASDGNLYGTTQNGPGTGEGDVFRITPQLDYSDAYTFPTNYDGDEPPGLFPGSDGRLYTTTFGGGTNGTGNVMAITTSGEGTVLYSFGPVSPTLSTPTDGWNPMAPPVQGADGAFYGTSSLGGVNFQGAAWRMAFSPPLPPPVQLTLSSQSVQAGEPVELSWKAVNAFSLTMQQCFAFVQNNASGAGNWAGQQKGSMTEGSYQGSATLTPTAVGTFTYALTCGGVESGFASLRVTGAAKKSSNVSFQIRPNQVNFGTQAQFVITVSGASGTPTGKVAISADGVKVATLSLTNGSVTATLPVSGFPAGTYEVTANYLGDANFAPATSAPESATILPAQSPTRTFIYYTAGGEAFVGKTFQASVLLYSIPQNSTPTGTLNFYLSGKFIGTGDIVGNQIFESNPLSTEGFPAGTYSLTAVYSGDENNAPSTSVANTTNTTNAIYLGVGPNSTMLGVNPVTVTVPGNVTLTARVLDIPDNLWPDSGEVVFYANGTKFGSASINSDGVAKLTVSTKGIAPGVYLVTAQYQGNSTFGQSTSWQQTVTLK